MVDHHLVFLEYRCLLDLDKDFIVVIEQPGVWRTQALGFS